jgi:hypothetical protein
VWQPQRKDLAQTTPYVFPKGNRAGFFDETNFSVEPIEDEAVVGRLRSSACYEAGVGTNQIRNKKRDFPMSQMPPSPDQRLAIFVLAALIAVLTIATATMPAAAATVVQDTVAQNERFQAPQVRTLPPFGARNVLAPIESQKRQRLPGAAAAR